MEKAYIADSQVRYDHLLWSVAIGAAVVDMLLTMMGLSLCFTEANPVARTALDVAGGAGLFGLKLLAIGLLSIVYWYVSPLYRRVALIAFSIPQLVAVGHNGLLLARYAPNCV